MFLTLLLYFWSQHCFFLSNVNFFLKGMISFFIHNALRFSPVLFHWNASNCDTEGHCMLQSSICSTVNRRLMTRVFLNSETKSKTPMFMDVMQTLFYIRLNQMGWLPALDFRLKFDLFRWSSAVNVMNQKDSLIPAMWPRLLPRGLWVALLCLAVMYTTFFFFF